MAHALICLVALAAAFDGPSWSIQDAVLRRGRRPACEQPPQNPQPAIDPFLPQPPDEPCEKPAPCKGGCDGDCCKCDRCQKPAPACECSRLVDGLIEQVSENTKLELRLAESRKEVAEVR